MSRFRSWLLGIGAVVVIAGMFVMPAIAENTATPGPEALKEAAAAPSNTSVDGPKVDRSKTVEDSRAVLAKRSALAKARIPQSVRRAELSQRESCWQFWCRSHFVLILGIAY